MNKLITDKKYTQNITNYHENEKQAEHNRNYSSHTWNIKIKHYLNTLKKKPGAIHRSTAMQQVNPKLQNIYTKYYTQNPKDFLDLIEIVSKEGLESIERAIKVLERINPMDINTEKIKMICNRKEETITDKATENTDIEDHSKIILNHYGNLLKGSAEDFDKEALII